MELLRKLKGVIKGEMRKGLGEGEQLLQGILSSAGGESSYWNWMQKAAQASNAWLQQGWGRGRQMFVLQTIKYIDLIQKKGNLQIYRWNNCI